MTRAIEGEEVRDEVIEVRCIVGSSDFMGPFGYFNDGLNVCFLPWIVNWQLAGIVLGLLLYYLHTGPGM